MSLTASASYPPLTTFQSQVLEAIAAGEDDPSPRARWESQIAKRGKQLFGEDWAPGQYSQARGPAYPSLNRVFGGLRRKGFIIRDGDWEGPGLWRLSDLGCQFFGMEES